MNRFSNRKDAGLQLSRVLLDYANRTDTIVLALPRGGVPVAYQVAKAIHAPLDVLIVRKLGVPSQPELAFGAITLGCPPVFNQDIIRDLHLTQAAIADVIADEQAELLRRNERYRGQKPWPTIAGKTVILIDDGMATGATLRVAIKSLRAMAAARIVVAIPVGDKQLCDRMAPLADEFICLVRPEHFYSVGAWYEDFSQTEDEEVLRLLG